MGKAHAGAIRSVVEAFSAPLVFFGDLDPLDLATFITLERCLRSLCLPMSDPEQEALRRAETIGLGWAALAGPRGSALLGSGVKLELEGATSPHFFSPDLVGELARHVLD